MKKKKKNILEEAADKFLEQYDNREFLEKLRAERGPSIIAAQKVKKSYSKKLRSCIAVATVLLCAVVITSCYYFVIAPNSDDNNYFNQRADGYLPSSMNEVNNVLDNFKINDIETTVVSKLTFTNATDLDKAFKIFYSDEQKKMQITVDANSRWDYKKINMLDYDKTIKKQGHIMVYKESTETINEINHHKAEAYIQLNDIKIHFEYLEKTNNEVGDFLNMLELFVG